MLDSLIPAGGKVRELPDVEAQEYIERNPFTWAILGPKGSGKSLVSCCLAALGYEAGLNVWHNGGLKFGELLDVEAFINLRLMDGIIVLDEVHRWADCRAGMKLFSRDLTAVLLQTRKLNLSIIWCTHRANLVDRRLRDATELWLDAYTEDGGRNVLLTATDVNEFISPSHISNTVLLADAWRYHRYYDTESLFAAMTDNTSSTDRKNSKSYQEAVQVETAIRAMAHAGYEKVSPTEIAKVLHDWRDKGYPTLAPERVGRILGLLGVPRSRGNNGVQYDLQAFFNST